MTFKGLLLTPIALAALAGMAGAHHEHLGVKPRAENVSPTALPARTGQRSATTAPTAGPAETSEARTSVVPYLQTTEAPFTLPQTARPQLKATAFTGMNVENYPEERIRLEGPSFSTVGDVPAGFLVQPFDGRTSLTLRYGGGPLTMGFCVFAANELPKGFPESGAIGYTKALIQRRQALGERITVLRGPAKPPADTMFYFLYQTPVEILLRIEPPNNRPMLRYEGWIVTCGKPVQFFVEGPEAIVLRARPEISRFLSSLSEPVTPER